MKRIISLFFIIMLVLCSLLNFIVYADDNSNYVEDGVFYYYFEDASTFTVLTGILHEYNNAFGYQITPNLEFKMGKKSDEFVFISFDENGIAVFIDNYYISEIDEEDKEFYLSVLLSYAYGELDADYLHSFISALTEVDTKLKLGTFIIPFIFGGSSHIPQYKIFLFNNEWLNAVIIGVSVLLCLIFLLFVLKNIKKIINRDRKYISYTVFLSFCIVYIIGSFILIFVL